MAPIIISMSKVFLSKNQKRERALDLEETTIIKTLNCGLIKTFKNQQYSMAKIQPMVMDP